MAHILMHIDSYFDAHRAINHTLMCSAAESRSTRRGSPTPQVASAPGMATMSELESYFQVCGGLKGSTVAVDAFVLVADRSARMLFIAALA